MELSLCRNRNECTGYLPVWHSDSAPANRKYLEQNNCRSVWLIQPFVWRCIVGSRRLANSVLDVSKENLSECMKAFIKSLFRCRPAPGEKSQSCLLPSKVNSLLTTFPPFYAKPTMNAESFFIIAANAGRCPRN